MNSIWQINADFNERREELTLRKGRWITRPTASVSDGLFINERENPVETSERLRNCKLRHGGQRTGEREIKRQSKQEKYRVIGECLYNEIFYTLHSTLYEVDVFHKLPERASVRLLPRPTTDHRCTYVEGGT